MMDEFPDTVVAVMNHFLGGATNPYTIVRDNFYNVTYTPWLQFDGLQEGWPIGTYRSKYLARQAIPTDVTIELSGEFVGERTFDFTANVCLEAGGADKTVRVYMIEVLDHWPLGRWYYRNNVRQHAEPDVDVNLTAGNCVPLTHQLTFDETISWIRKWDTRIVVWAQEPVPSGPAEVYQAAQLAYPYFEQVIFFGDGLESGDTTGWAKVVSP